MKKLLAYLFFVPFAPLFILFFLIIIAGMWLERGLEWAINEVMT